MTLQHCNLLNISVCAASVQSSAAAVGFSLLLYNSLGWQRTAPVRVPLTGAYSWTVSGARTGMRILHETLHREVLCAESVELGLAYRCSNFCLNHLQRPAAMYMRRMAVISDIVTFWLRQPLDMCAADPAGKPVPTQAVPEAGQQHASCRA